MNCWKCDKKLEKKHKLPGPGNVHECDCGAENYGPDEDEDGED